MYGGIQRYDDFQTYRGMGYPNIWRHPNIWGHPKVLGLLNVWGVSKHIGGIQMYGGVQRYGGPNVLEVPKCMGEHGGHPNIWRHPNMWLASKGIGESKHRWCLNVWGHGQWERIGWVLLIAHVTSTLNC